MSLVNLPFSTLIVKKKTTHALNFPLYEFILIKFFWLKDFHNDDSESCKIRSNKYIIRNSVTFNIALVLAV